MSTVTPPDDHMAHPDQDQLPGLGRESASARSRTPRPVIAGLLVAVISAAAGAAIAREAWKGSSNPRSQGSVLSPGGAGSPSSGASAASTSVRAVARAVDPALVDVDTTLGGPYGGEAAGTGMVVTSSGEVLTNNHVISQAVRITATDLGNNRTYNARVVGYDATRDVAVIQLEGASGLSTVSFGDSHDVRVGESVITIGNAGGVGGTPSAAAGSVVALGQSIIAQDDSGSGATSEHLHGLIKLDGQLQPGDSGGPLVDRSAHVIGMDTAASQNFSFQSSGAQGFAIPIDTARAVAHEIVAGHGTDTIHIGATALIGVDIQSTYPETVCGFPGPAAHAAYVAGVVQGGPAQSAGIAACDTITAFAGHAVGSPTGLVRVKDRYHPGDRVQVSWVDGHGVRHSATLRLATGPAD